jgi:ABC-2 type transport system permease protein
MNLVVMRLTIRALLGRRRSLMLFGISGLLLAVAGLVRWGTGASITSSAATMQNFGLGTLVPVMCLLIGTGVIASEIEDGSIVYLLAKPIPRRTIAFSKLVVALGTSLVFTVAAMVAGVAIAGDQDWQLALGLGTATALASLAYTSVFFAIAIVSRNPIIVGLIYALLWEGVLAGYIPGVKDVSIRQWALAPAERLLASHPTWNVTSDLGMTPALILLGIATIAAVFVAVQRLKTLPIKVSE